MLLCLTFSLFVSFIVRSQTAELGAVIGDGAASQLLRHAAKILLSEPRYVDVILTSRDDPGLSPLAAVNAHSKIAYRNLSIHFHDRAVRFQFDKLKFQTFANISHLLWPLDVGEHSLDMNLEIPRGDVNILIGPETLSMGECSMIKPTFSGGLGDQWILEGALKMMASVMMPKLDSTICFMLQEYVNDVPHSNIMKFPIHSLLPPSAREFLAHEETNLLYQLSSVQIEENQINVRATIEWNKEAISSDPFTAANTSSFEVELKGDDRITLWIEDSVLNELINQVEWNFEWMSEKVAVTDPIIPYDSRDFLSTLCTECYFLLNVSAKGNPTIRATNESLVFEKCDRVNLRVVNPDRKLTSVFVSFVLTITAELRPSFENGILKTTVELLDTNVTMEKGAFPKTWALFMQDLMRGMILDMLWPEIKKVIEELSYGKGLKVSTHCGMDPNFSEIDINEGAFAVSTKLALQDLDIDKCVDEVKAAIPNTSKLFQKLDPANIHP